MPGCAYAAVLAALVNGRFEALNFGGWGIGVGRKALAALVSERAVVSLYRPPRVPIRPAERNAPSA